MLLGAGVELTRLLPVVAVSFSCALIKSRYSSPVPVSSGEADGSAAYWRSESPKLDLALRWEFEERAAGVWLGVDAGAARDELAESE